MHLGNGHNHYQYHHDVYQNARLPTGNMQGMPNINPMPPQLPVSANGMILPPPNGPNPASVEPIVNPSINHSTVEGSVADTVKVPVESEPVEYTGKYGPEVKAYTEEILACTLQLKNITGGSICFVGSGNPPHIPDIYMSRDDYAERSNKLTADVEAAEKAYEALVAVSPNDCMQYGEYVFGVDSAATIPDNVRKAAEKVKRARQIHRYFLDTKVSVDLKALRSDVLSLHESITMAKQHLRALQFNGVDIGTRIFPNRCAAASDGPKYTPMSG
jgi:hypothetical protein